MLNPDTRDPAMPDTQDPVGVLKFHWNKLVATLRSKRGEAGDPPPGDPPPADDRSWLTGIEGVDDAVKQHPSLAKITSVGELAKSYVGMQPLIGLEKLPIPRRDDKGQFVKADLDATFSRLGWPGTPEEYKLAIDRTKLPENFPMRDTKVAEFAKVAHSHNLLPNQVKGILDWYTQSEVTDYNQKVDGDKAEIVKAEAALRQEWGTAFDEKTTLAKRAFRAFADDEMVKIFEEGKGNDPRLIKLFAKIGEKMSEDGLFKGEGTQVLMSPKEAEAEIAKIRGDKKHPYNLGKDHPEHQLAVNRMNDLYAMANPETAKA